METLLPAPAPPLTPLQRFSGCLTFDDFQEAGVAPAFRAVDTQSACSSCHVTGEFQLDAEAVFTTITRSREVLARYIRIRGTRVLPDLMVSEQTLRAVSSRIGLYQAHPGFEVRGVLSSLDTWSALATQRQRDGMCGPPTALD